MFYLCTVTKADQVIWSNDWNAVCLSGTHWGRVTHMCFINLTIICSDNGLLPGRNQAIIWTSAWILLIGPLVTNFGDIFNQKSIIFFQENAFENVFCKIALISSRSQYVNTKGTREANTGQWTGSPLVQILACRMFGLISWPKSMPTHCLLDAPRTNVFHKTFLCTWISRLNKVDHIFILKIHPGFPGCQLMSPPMSASYLHLIQCY